MPGNINNVMTAIDYIESHLHEKLDLETVAGAVHFSKYHLHRMFTSTTGLTIHDYVQRRQLTEAAKLLVLSDRPILEIALSAGYESQQSFTDIFKAMYKKSPNQYRAEEEFYPLQLRYVLNEKPANLVEKEWQDKIAFATQEDIPSWMELVHLVIDGFPHLDEKQYLAQLQESVKSKRALILKDADTAIGIMAFNEITGSIDFFGVHPQYRKRDKKIFLFPYEAFKNVYCGLKHQNLVNSRVFFDIGILKFLAQFEFVLYRKAGREERCRFHTYIEELLKDDISYMLQEWKSSKKCINFPLRHKLAISLFLTRYYARLK